MSRYNKKYFTENRDNILSKQRESYRKHRTQRLKYAKNYRDENKDLLKSKRLGYRERNREVVNLRTREFHRRNKNTVIGHYSNDKYMCVCCGEKEYKFLTVDHIDGGGNKHRVQIKISAGTGFYTWLIKNNFPEGYQILCWNCNLGRAKNKGICPHRENQSSHRQRHLCNGINSAENKEGDSLRLGVTEAE